MEKQELSIDQTGTIGNENVVCVLHTGSKHNPVCRRCCFDHQVMSETCDKVNCMPGERKDGKRVYFELIHQQA